MPHDSSRHKPSIMVSYFDYSGVMCLPWALSDHLCYAIDLQHPTGQSTHPLHPNITRVGADAMNFIPPMRSFNISGNEVKLPIAFASFFPPCTDVASSGAAHFADKGLHALISALTLFKRSIDLATLFDCPYLIENPVSTISTYWRKPDHLFCPNEYGAPYTKKTCLWTGGGFKMPSPIPVSERSEINPNWHSNMPNSKQRSNHRSKTPEGFAFAVYEANCPVRLFPNN